MAASNPTSFPVALTRLKLTWTPDQDVPGTYRTRAHRLPWQLVSNDPVPGTYALLCDDRLVSRSSALPPTWTLAPGVEAHPGLLELTVPAPLEQRLADRIVGRGLFTSQPAGQEPSPLDPWLCDNELEPSEPAPEWQYWVTHDGDLWPGSVQERGLSVQVLPTRGLLPLERRARLMRFLADHDVRSVWVADPNDSSCGDPTAVPLTKGALTGLSRGLRSSEGGNSRRLLLLAPQVQVVYWADRAARIAVLCGPEDLVPRISGLTSAQAEHALAAHARVVKAAGDPNRLLAGLAAVAQAHLGRVPWDTPGGPDASAG